MGDTRKKWEDSDKLRSRVTRMGGIEHGKVGKVQSWRAVSWGAVAGLLAELWRAGGGQAGDGASGMHFGTPRGAASWPCGSRVCAWEVKVRVRVTEAVCAGETLSFPGRYGRNCVPLPRIHVEALTPQTRDCDLIWK